MSRDDEPGTPAVDACGAADAADLAAALQRARDEVAGLQAALDSRGPIEQAKGVVMALYRVDAERAWQLLQTASSHLNLKLRTVATTVLALASGTGVEPDLGMRVTARVLRPAATDPVTAAFVARLVAGRPTPRPVPARPFPDPASSTGAPGTRPRCPVSPPG